MSWVQGRRLSSITTGGTTTTYAYDMDGIRRSKASGGVTTEFITQSGLVVRQTNGTVTLDFVYDSQQRPYALIYKNGTAAAVKYYYLLNLQGDVVGLLSSSGAVVARYSYNAWGKLLSVTDDNGAAITSSSHIANLNPLRYRGYYYDVETGFYYLQSRYYDPSIGRFINADSLIITDISMENCNLFSYCGNNPVNNSDPSGSCYYDKNGNWCHDNWEYLGGYVRKPEPTGRSVYSYSVSSGNSITSYSYFDSCEEARKYIDNTIPRIETPVSNAIGALTSFSFAISQVKKVNNVNTFLGSEVLANAGAGTLVSAALLGYSLCVSIYAENRESEIKKYKTYVDNLGTEQVLVTIKVWDTGSINCFVHSWE